MASAQTIQKRKLLKSIASTINSRFGEPVASPENELLRTMTELFYHVMTNGQARDVFEEYPRLRPQGDMAEHLEEMFPSPNQLSLFESQEARSA